MVCLSGPQGVATASAEAFKKYVSKLDEYKVKSGDTVQSDVKEVLTHARAMAATITILKANHEGLEGVPLRGRMLEAQKILRAGVVPPTALRPAVKTFYLASLAMA